MPRIVVLCLLLTALAGCTNAEEPTPPAPPQDVDEEPVQTPPGPVEEAPPVVPEEPTTPNASAPPLKPRDLFWVSANLPVADPFTYDGSFRCGGPSAFTATPLRGLSWQNLELSQDVTNWTVRIDVTGYMYSFPPNPKAPNWTSDLVVPANATAIHICNYQAPGTPFKIHFMPPELAAGLEGGHEFSGNLGDPDPMWRTTGNCKADIGPYSDHVSPRTTRRHAIPEDAWGQPFAIGDEGLVVDFIGGAPQPAAPLGIVPEGATEMLVCSGNMPPLVAYTVLVGKKTL